MSPEIPRLGWRFSCERHKLLFVNVLRSEGVESPEDMEAIRRRFLAWLSEQVLFAVFNHMNDGHCIACDREAHHLTLSPWGAKLRELAKASSPPP